MDHIRSFIAIELPETAKECLFRCQTALGAAKNQRVKWVHPNNIHLTLKFLGAISTGIIVDIVDALKLISVDVFPFRLTLTSPGAFPNTKTPRVLFVGIGGDTKNLIALQKLIDYQIGLLGFKPENRPFSPHLTLGRVRDNSTSQELFNLGKMLTATMFESNISFHVNSISLMQSTLTPRGAMYNRLASISLGDALPKAQG